MKLYRFIDPIDGTYARASRVGGVCQDGEYRARNGVILVEWEIGSSLVGDFVWPGFTLEVLASTNVATKLAQSKIAGFELRNVEYRVDPARRGRKPRKPCVWPPFDDLGLWDLWPTQWVKHVEDLTTTVYVPNEKYGGGWTQLSGIEEKSSRWNKETEELEPVHIPRKPGQGLSVPYVRGIFRVEAYGGWIFCSEDVRDLILEHEFTNVDFLEMGDILDE